MEIFKWFIRLIIYVKHFKIWYRKVSNKIHCKEIAKISFTKCAKIRHHNTVIKPECLVNKIQLLFITFCSLIYWAYKLIYVYVCNKVTGLRRFRYCKVSNLFVVIVCLDSLLFNYPWNKLLTLYSYHYTKAIL